MSHRGFFYACNFGMGVNRHNPQDHNEAERNINMKKITSYQTTDNKTFTNMAEARLHQSEIDFVNVITAECEPLFKASPDARRLLPVMLAEPQFFIDTLTAYAKNLRKIKPTVVETEEVQLIAA